MYSLQISCFLFITIVGSIHSFTVNQGSRTQVPTAIFSTTDEKPNQTEGNQSKYGNELAYPDTYVRCGRCATSFAIKEEDLGSGKGR